MVVATTLSVAAVVLAAAALLPGSLGFLIYTHRVTAHPLGGRIFMDLAAPLWGLSLALLAAGVALAARGPGSPAVALGAAVAFVAITAFAFFMHTRLMFKPVREPLYLTPEQAVERFGEDEEVVGVIDGEGRPWAYVARLARRPHIVYQRQGEHPFVMSHCVLAHSSMGWELDERFTGEGIRISSVLANNLVFYDGANRCSVLQVENRALDDSYRLATLPTVMTSLGTWRRLYPDSKVWYRPREWRDTFYLKLLARASVIDPASPDLVYPLERPADERLPLKAYVLGVSRGEETKAYRHEIFRRGSLLEDEVGGEPLVFFATAGGDFVQLYSRRLGERILHFRAVGEERFTDAETGSVWDVTGRSIEGELAGKRLSPLPHFNKIFWCVWADFFPATSVWDEPA